MDTKYATKADIKALATRPAGAVMVYAPPSPEGEAVKPRSVAHRAYRRSREPEAIKQWRVRMASEEGQSVFKRRRRIELVHAHTKARGLGRIGLRGLAKAQVAALWHALAHNLLVGHRLRMAAV